MDNHEKYFYDDAGNLQRLVTHDPAGGHLEETTFVHDSLNRLIQINPPTGPPITFKYDKGNRRTEAASAAGICKWTYTTLNQVATVEGPHGLRLSFHYDPLGGTDSITYPGNRTVTYQNDAAGRFQSVTDWQGRSITQSYTLGDRPLQIQFPNGIKTDLDHDTEGRLNSLSHHKGAEPPLFSATYDYDDLGDLTSVPDFPVDTSVLSYPRTYGDANQLLTVQGTPVLHDHRGNITRAKLSPTNAATDTLTWDYANRLTAGTVGGAPFTNTFDAQSHRIATTRGGVTTGFLLDDRGAMPRIMTELDAANSPTAFYLYAGQSLLARVLPDGTISYYHGDHQGNTILMTDGTGSSAAHYQYDTFGTLVASSGPLAPSNHFRYLGGLGVRDNLDGTLDARARTYHTRFGRFLSRDALYGNQTDGQSLNRYVYALNDPYGLGDPSGFDAVSQAIYDGADFLQLTALYTADTINAPYRYGYRLLTHPVTTIKNTHPIDAWRRMGENIYGALEDQAVNGLHLPKTIDGKARLASGLLFLGVGAEGSPAAVAEEGSGIVNQIELADKFSRTPKGLMDQMVLDAAKKGAGDRIMSNLGDPKFKGMEKWSYSEVSEQGIRSEVHYVRNPATGELMDFKFKIHAETYK